MPGPSQRTELELQVLRSLRRIVRLVAVHSKRMSAAKGLTLPQLLCLRAIRDMDAEERTLAAVADAMQSSRSTVSTLVERLVRAGLVSRERGTRDRRQVHLSLTPAGQARLDDAVQQSLEDSFLERVMGLEPGRQRELLDALDQVVRLVDGS